MKQDVRRKSLTKTDEANCKMMTLYSLTCLMVVTIIIYIVFFTVDPIEIEDEF